jgi:tRNA-Thr(GGU) m(6)t(6)A37 methyltransferase TsaA
MTRKDGRLKRIRPIGFVVPRRWKKGAIGRLSAGLATIRLNAGLARGLVGLERYSHVLVVLQMTGARFRRKNDLIYRPHVDKRRAPAGIFAQRCPHRPNLIGVSTVRVVAVVGRDLTVRGLDAWDGTPVLDIKPYWPAFDRPDGRVTVPPWIRS